MKELPIKYKERMKPLLGEEFSDYEKALTEAPVRAFRVNTEKISPDEFEKMAHTAFDSMGMLFGVDRYKFTVDDVVKIYEESFE